MLILNPARLSNLVKNATLPVYYALPVDQAGESIEISPPDEASENSGTSKNEAATLEVILDPICFELNTQNLDDQNSASSINEKVSNLDTNNIFKGKKQKGKLQVLILSSLIFLNQSEIKIDEHIQYQPCLYGSESLQPDFAL